MRHFLETIFNCRWLPLTCIVILISVSGRAIGGASKDPATPAFKVAIEKHPNALQGHYSPVDIRLHSGQDRITGFSFLIAYDTTQLRLKLAEPSGFLKGRGWGKFSVDSVAANPVDSAGSLRLLRITASVGDKPIPDSTQKPSDGLVRFVFFVSDNPNLECQFLPVRFFWRTCEDNIIFAGTDETPYYARSIIDTKTPWEDMYDLAGDCFLDVKKTPPTPTPCRDEDTLSSRHAVIYTDGGVQIYCAESSCVLGDVNLNGLPSEQSDVAALARLIIYGSFCPYLSDSIQYVTQQVIRSPFDENGLSISSLVYMIRNIGGGLPRGIGAGNDSTTVAAKISRDSLTLHAHSSARLGALMLTFSCDDDLMLPLTSGQAFDAQIRYAAHDGRLNLLVYWPGESFLADGRQSLGTMALPGVKRLIGAEAVDYYSRPVKVTPPGD